jgi:ComF family protein
MFRMPLTYFWDSPEDNKMARLLWGRMNLERAAALCYYGSETRVARIVHHLKYYGRKDLAVEMGKLMGRKMGEHDFFRDMDAIIPVPLAKKRQRSRGYNQSQMIAEGLHAVTGLPVCNHVLERTEFSASQTHLNVFERHENVAKSFRLQDKLMEADWNCEGMNLKGKHLLLVDDVMTTGSTIIACATQLQCIPDVKISVLTIGFTK